MLLLIPIILLLLVPLIMLTLSRLQRPFRYYWLLAVGGAGLAWLSIWVLRIRLDAAVQLSQWRPLELFEQSPMLAVDAFSWPFAIALGTIALAVILTDIGRSEEADWYSWASSLALAALGLVAVLAGNLLTLVLAWTVIDVLEFFILSALPQHRPGPSQSGHPFLHQSLRNHVPVVGQCGCKLSGAQLAVRFYPCFGKCLCLDRSGSAHGRIALECVLLGGTPITPRPGHFAAYGVCLPPA